MSARAVRGRDGAAALDVDCAYGSATLHLQGAHLVSWIPAGGEERLFVSEAARFGPGESIRGGVPICFPQFAELGPLPMHGFAHVVPWEWSGHTETGVVLTLRDSDATRSVWPHRFTAQYAVDLAPSTLHLAFSVRNDDAAPLLWSGTLHTFCAMDARQARIRGLGPAWFVDRGHGGRLTEDPDDVLRVPGYTDRVYLDAGPEVHVDDGRGRLVIAQTGFRDTVVWNPGPETSRRFPDLAPDEHERFVCIEAAEVRPVEIAPQGAWQGSQTLKIVGD
ncbi:MAG TPA: D-hexose-6-phosphate mutarotase [Burkholderiaceae bacterium]|nr:D-hexose-6-phosphate mutarotase [Burkholderiaceae bacterium]